MLEIIMWLDFEKIGDELEEFLKFKRVVENSATPLYNRIKQ